MRVFYLLLAFVCLALPARATQYWELTPGRDPRMAVGTYTVAKGEIAPAGINFTLKNNTLDNPVQLTLVSTKAGAALHLSAFTDAEPFLEKDTGPDGSLVVRFRTGNDMNFKVTGPAGATYQIAVWRGPAIKIPHKDPVVAMDAAEAGGAPATPPQPAPAKPQPPAPASNTFLYVLLGGIFAVLIVIAGLLYRGQAMRRKP